MAIQTPEHDTQLSVSPVEQFEQAKISTLEKVDMTLKAAIDIEHALLVELELEENPDLLRERRRTAKQAELSIRGIATSRGLVYRSRPD